jgi:hypothetical protein
MRAVPSVLTLALAAAACTKSADLTKDCKLTPIAAGWFDAGVTAEGKNKLVPSISFTLTNTGAEAWGPMQINCIFKRLGDHEERSTVLVRARQRARAIWPPAPARRLLLARQRGLHRH